MLHYLLMLLLELILDMPSLKNLEHFCMLLLKALEVLEECLLIHFKGLLLHLDFLKFLLGSLSL